MFHTASSAHSNLPQSDNSLLTVLETHLLVLPWPGSSWQVVVRWPAQSSQSLTLTLLLTWLEHWEKQSSWWRVSSWGQEA